MFDIPVVAVGPAALTAVVERLLAEMFLDPVDPNESANVSIAILQLP